MCPPGLHVGRLYAWQGWANWSYMGSQLGSNHHSLQGTWGLCLFGTPRWCLHNNQWWWRFALVDRSPHAGDSDQPECQWTLLLLHHPVLHHQSWSSYDHSVPLVGLLLFLYWACKDTWWQPLGRIRCWHRPGQSSQHECRQREHAPQQQWLVLGPWHPRVGHAGAQLCLTFLPMPFKSRWPQSLVWPIRTIHSVPGKQVGTALECGWNRAPQWAGAGWFAQCLSVSQLPPTPLWFLRCSSRNLGPKWSSLSKPLSSGRWLWQSWKWLQIHEAAIYDSHFQQS